VFRSGSSQRSKPFDVHSFFSAQLPKVNMGDSEKYSEKERMSADIGSPVRDTAAPMLPTVNPEVQKMEPPASKIHPAFYVM
jgi:hypothetical protein